MKTPNPRRLGGSCAHFNTWWWRSFLWPFTLLSPPPFPALYTSHFTLLIHNFSLLEAIHRTPWLPRSQLSMPFDPSISTPPLMKTLRLVLSKPPCPSLDPPKNSAPISSHANLPRLHQVVANPPLSLFPML